MQVARTWARAGIQPFRVESYVASDDPECESKAVDVIGLYLNPPQHAVVFSVVGSYSAGSSVVGSALGASVGASVGAWVGSSVGVGVSLMTSPW
jgi:hypothetical protein